jgi:hypothetical protein
MLEVSTPRELGATAGMLDLVLRSLKDLKSKPMVEITSPGRTSISHRLYISRSDFREESRKRR